MEMSSDESFLPLHVARSPSMLLLHQGESSSSEESSASGFYRSPLSSSINENESFRLPTWSSNPQSPGADGRTAQIQVATPSNPSTSRIPVFASFLVFTLVLLGTATVYTSQSTVKAATLQVTVLKNNRKELDSRILSYEKDIRGLEREISAMDLLIQKQQSVETDAFLTQTSHRRALSEMNELQQRLKTEAMQAQNLKSQVQEMSRNEVVGKYGRGIHRVEMELVFPDHQGGPTRFIIELAPVDMMPHSVHTFLEMVSTGLLDGCSFIMNALHVLKAAPLPYDGTSAVEKAKAFSEKGLESVAFKEYNGGYPHKRYTIGFAADGSPSFYINTDDNSEIHIGDPCFGTVVSGFDTVQRLEANPTRNGIWFERRIGIKSARVLRD